MRIIGRNRGRGQSLVEFALVFPVMIVILFGIIDLGRAVYAYTTIANAARSGARVATVNQIETSGGRCDQAVPITNPADPDWSVKACTAQAAIGLGAIESDVTVTYSAPPSLPSLTCDSDGRPLTVGCLVDVTMVHSWQPITPVIGNIWSSITMSSTSQSTVERIFP